MSFITLFSTIHGYYYIISTNIYLYTKNFQFQQNKQISNRPLEGVWIQMKFGAFCVLCFMFPFFLFSFLIPKEHTRGTQICQWVLCTVHGIHYSLNVHTFHWNSTVSGSHVLFTGPTNIFFAKTLIKNGSHGTIHIFKNYFVTVFSVFSF